MTIELGRRGLIAGSLALGAAGAALLPARLATAAEEAALAAGARGESGGMLYSVIEPTVNQAFLAAFKAKYGLDVQFQRLGSGPLGQRFAAENTAGAPTADLVMIGDAGFLADAAQKNWIRAPGSLPALDPLARTLWDGTVATVAYNPESLAWNTSLVTTAPKGWEALIDPAFAGRVLVFDPRNSILGVMWYSLIRKAHGDDFLRRLARQATLAPSVVPAMQQVAAGAAAMYAPAIHVVVASLKERGAPVEEAFFEPASPAPIYAAIAARTTRPNTARLLLNYAMTIEGQAILNRDGFSPLTGVPGTRPLPNMTAVSTAEATRERPEILGLLGIS
jgi:iron(III) transport system substrate-binding protein